MSQSQDDMIKKYLSRAIDVSEQRQQVMDDEELRTIAREVGLSDDDLRAAEQAGREAHQRGVNFLKHGRPDDAIDELEEAVVLLPGRLDVRAALAQAFRDRWRRNHAEEDRLKAMALARECLKIEPDHAQSYELLNQLDARDYPATFTPQPRAPQASNANAGPLILVAVVAGLAVMVVAGVGVAMLVFTGNTPEPDPIANLPPMVTDPSLVKTPSPNAPVIPSSVNTTGTIYDRGNPQIPVEFINNTRVKAQLTSPLSHLKVYSTTRTAFYEGWISLENKDLGGEVAELKISIKLLDAKGEVLYSDSRSVVSKYLGDPARPGDTLSYKYLKQVTPLVAKAQVTVDSLVVRPNPKAAPDTPLTIGWDVPSQKTDKLVIKRRSAAFKTYTSNKAEGYFKPVFTVENTDTRPITKLKLNLTMSDDQGNVLDKRPKYVVGISYPPVRPGERRVTGGTYKLPRSFKKFTVSVAEIEFGQ